MTELLPCPKCGKAPVALMVRRASGPDGARVACVRCGIRVDDALGDMDAARRRWNVREATRG